MLHSASSALFCPVIRSLFMLRWSRLFSELFFFAVYLLLGLLRENERRINFVFPSRAVIQEFSLRSTPRTGSMGGRPSSFMIWPLKVCFLFDISTFSPSAFRVSYRCFLACQTFCLFAFLFFFAKAELATPPRWHSANNLPLLQLLPVMDKINRAAFAAITRRPRYCSSHTQPNNSRQRQFSIRVFIFLGKTGGSQLRKEQKCVAEEHESTSMT